MTSRVAALAVILVVISTTALAAQEIGSHPASERGRRSIVLDVSGGPQIGYWTRRSDRTDLGLDFGVGGMLSHDVDNVSISLTPAIKRYLSTTGPLAPYTYFGVPLTYSRSEFDNTGAPDDNVNTYALGGLVGFGLEWFPIAQVSIGGHVGLRGEFMHRDDDEGNTIRFGTTSSGIRVHLYV